MARRRVAVLDKESMSEKFKSLTLRFCRLRRRRPEKKKVPPLHPRTLAWCWSPGHRSGKTTTLYAALSEIKNDEDKIVTIEDPSRYQVRGITQISREREERLTFARGLRSILRHDPDKYQGARLTRQRNGADRDLIRADGPPWSSPPSTPPTSVDVLGRFLTWASKPYNFVSALNCILAQRLVTHVVRPAGVLSTPSRIDAESI